MDTYSFVVLPYELIPQSAEIFRNKAKWLSFGAALQAQKGQDNPEETNGVRDTFSSPVAPPKQVRSSDMSKEAVIDFLPEKIGRPSTPFRNGNSIILILLIILDPMDIESGSRPTSPDRGEIIYIGEDEARGRKQANGTTKRKRSNSTDSVPTNGQAGQEIIYIGDEKDRRKRMRSSSDPPVPASHNSQPTNGSDVSRSGLLNFMGYKKSNPNVEEPIVIQQVPLSFPFLVLFPGLQVRVYLVTNSDFREAFSIGKAGVQVQNLTSNYCYNLHLLLKSTMLITIMGITWEVSLMVEAHHPLMVLSLKNQNHVIE